MLIFHANALDLERPILPGMDDTDTLVDPGGWDAVIYGHVHAQSITVVDGCHLVNVASVGFPTDGIPKPAYTEFILDGGTWEIRQHRIDYDLEQAEAVIRASTMPDSEVVVTLLRSARRVRGG